MKGTTLRAALVVFTLVIAVLTAQAASITIVNNSFESPAQGGMYGPDWSKPCPDGWTAEKGALSGDYYAPQTNVALGGWGSGQAAIFQAWNGYSQISQNLGNVQPNTVYTLSLVAGSFWGDTGNYSFELLAGDQPIVSMTGVVNSLAGMGWNGVSWGQHGTAMTASSLATASSLETGTPLTVVIKLFNANGSGAMAADDVVVTATPAPEPMTMGLLAIGGMGMIIRRKK